MWSLLPGGLLIQAGNSIPWPWLQWALEAGGRLIRVGVYSTYHLQVTLFIVFENKRLPRQPGEKKKIREKKGAQANVEHTRSNRD